MHKNACCTTSHGKVRSRLLGGKTGWDREAGLSQREGRQSIIGPGGRGGAPVRKG